MRSNAAERPEQSIAARLRGMAATLPPIARRIADYVLEHRADVIHMSITEVAEAAKVSEGSIVGLCQQLGLKGFQGLKIALAQDLVEAVIRAEAFTQRPQESRSHRQLERDPEDRLPHVQLLHGPADAPAQKLGVGHEPGIVKDARVQPVDG